MRLWGPRPVPLSRQKPTADSYGRHHRAASPGGHFDFGMTTRRPTWMHPGLLIGVHLFETSSIVARIEGTPTWISGLSAVLRLFAHRRKA
jgi:hypothetical protein